MKIICSKQVLVDHINIVSKAVSAKTTLPILECILLMANDQGFRFISNDLEMGIKTAPLEADVQETGSIALESKMFSEIIRKMPEGDISISTNDKFVATISLGKVEFNILGLNGEEFPYLPLIEKESGYEISSLEFKNMIRQTIFSISTDDSKPIFTGELMEIVDGSLHLVAVDGYRISLRTSDIENHEGEEIYLIIPGKSLNELSKILPSGNDDILRFYVTDKHVMFETQEYTLISRLIEGEFLKYQQSFTNDYATLIQLRRQNLLQSLERATLLSRDQKKNPIKLHLQDSNLIITAQTEMGTSYDEIEIIITGEEILEIAFNPRYLIDVLRVIEDDEITIQFTTALSPCIIKGVEQNTYQYLILPLRLKQ